MRTESVCVASVVVVVGRGGGGNSITMLSCRTVAGGVETAGIANFPI